MGRRSRGVFATACLALLGLAALTGDEPAPAGAAGAFPGQGFLPDNRAWEMVSPADKNGGYVIPDSGRTRAAADGSAIGFISLAAFGDAAGQGVTADYIAQRSTNPNPGHSGWSTHAIMPKQESATLFGVFGQIEPRYFGEFTEDLQRGVFFAKTPLTEDEGVKEVLNLYRRTDLRTPGPGSYELLTACPHCELTGNPLPALPDHEKVFSLRPFLAGASPALEHVIFQSQQRLTTDTPEPFTERSRLYESLEGQVRLAGRIPGGTAIACDDAGGPACIAAGVSLVGQGVVENQLTPHTVSDGSDGHRRVFFMVPTDETNKPVVEGQVGNLYVRTDGSSTAHLNATDERKVPDKFAPAQYWDATPDGSKVLFTTEQALTEDAPDDTGIKLYIYDTTKPASAPDNLTFLSPDEEPVDFSSVFGAIGLSPDGARVYFIAAGQLLKGEMLLHGDHGIYMWEEGTLKFLVPLLPSGAQGQSYDLISITPSANVSPRQARITPDGRHLLFSTFSGESVLSRYGGVDYDHGVCQGSGRGCREFYLYDAGADEMQCVSCRPDGGPSVAGVEMARNVVRTIEGGARTDKHETRALSDDARYVFFSTGQKLVPGDTNGTTDAYVYDTSTEKASLLSSGEDSSPSWFMDASADGSDAFILTRERLSGWDIGNDYDLYDARIGGGFPEPPPPPPGCEGDACQPPPLSLNDPTPGTASLTGPGDPVAGKHPRCPKGKRRVKARGGKSRCVKKSRRGATRNRRAGR